MKYATITTILASAATAGAVVSVPIAHADDATTTPIGEQAELVDGGVVQGWTVSDLKTSTDTIPYPVSGTLWEATATDEAIQGAVTPIISNLNARTATGETYRALFQVPTPQGINPSTVGQGDETTGKVYFDVTGAQPDSVVYNAGGRDLLAWEQAPPSASRTTPSPARSRTTPITPRNQGTPTPTVGQPAPAPAGTQATPLPAGSQGTPLPADSQGTPQPASNEETPTSPVPPPPA